jgi:hypothetical protein
MLMQRYQKKRRRQMTWLHQQACSLTRLAMLRGLLFCAKGAADADAKAAEEKEEADGAIIRLNNCITISHVGCFHTFSTAANVCCSACTCRGLQMPRDLVNFYPYFYTKDLVAALALSFGAAYLVNFS